MMKGKEIEMKQTYDCYFSPPEARKVETIAVICPFSFQGQVKSKMFGAKLDFKQQGLTEMYETITKYYSNGYRLATTLPVGQSSMQSQAGFGTSNTSQQSAMKLIFQQLSADQSSGAPPPAYTEFTILQFSIDITMGMRGTTVAEFDVLSLLKKWGEDGWEMISLMPMPLANMPQPGLNTTYQMSYQIFMQRVGGTPTPVQYIMLKVNQEFKGMKVTGDLVGTIDAAAEKGWSYKAFLNLPGTMSGMGKMVMENRLYFSWRNPYIA